MTNQFGLSTEEALQKLKINIEEELQIFTKHKEKKWYYILTDMLTSKYIPFTWFGVAILIIEVIFLLVACFELTGVRLVSSCFEIVLLVVFSSLLVVCCVHEHKLKVHEMERLISSFIETITYERQWSYEDYPDLSLPETNSISLIWTYRDSKIVNLPHNLLVEGDIIILGPSRTAPAECRQVSNISPKNSPFKSKSVNLEAGDIFNPSIENEDSSYQPYPRQRFEVLQAPARSMVKTYLHSCLKKRSTILDSNICLIIHLFETRIIWVIAVISLAVNVFRWLFFHKDVGNYGEMLFSFQAYAILPLIPIFYPVLWIAVTLYGTARLRILFEMYTQRSFDPIETEEISLDHVNCQKVLSYFWQMVIGNPQGLPRTVNLLHTLGSVTTFCCVDKEGILCYTNPVPEKVFFFKDQKKMKHSHEIHNLLEETCEFYVKKKSITSSSEECSSNNDIEVLNISPDPKSPYGIQFDDPDWEQMLPSLKPLGVNMLLNSPCQYPIKSLRTQDFSRHLSLAGNHNVVSSYQGCLCPMAKQIGFQDRILSMFRNKQQVMAYRPLNAVEDNTPSEFFLSILKEKHVPLMIASVISSGKRGVSQLLTQGSADLILDVCSDVWNGEEISPFTASEKKKALSFFQRMSITRKCVAFSYRPIFNEDKECNDIYLEFPSHPPKKDSLTTPKKDKTKTMKPEILFKKIRSDIQCEDILQPTCQNRSDNDMHIRNLQKQIFLGMVTLSDSLQEDVVSTVEHLNNAGVRFVHFSYDNELLSRVFCQRLGLETGWNCHISLGESHGTTTNIDDNSSSVSEACPLLNDDENEHLDPAEIRVIRSDSYVQDKHYNDDYEVNGPCYDNYDELYFMSNRSKLPKGIQNMRAHLERIDDVPLLVPLFTDCNSDAVAEMIAIMQEYGEIVCCSGSILNSTNFKIFSQSDISIAMEPIFHRTCFLKQGHHLHEENVRTSTNADVSVSDPDVCELISNQGPLALSSALNNIPCSLSCNRQDNFPIAPLLCEARRITAGCESCFLFLLSCQLSLSLLMLFSSLSMLPPPLSGLQMLWLITVIIPILGVSLIGTPADEDIMKTITGKREKTQLLKGFVIPYVKLFSPPFILNSIFVSIFMFPWLLNSFCRISTERNCHWIFGAVNATSTWNGLYDEYVGGYFFVQDIVLFNVTLSFIALSISFVYRKNLIWRKTPTNNKPWCLCILITFLLQLLHSVCSIYHWTEERLQMRLSIAHIPFMLVIAGIVWLFVLVLLSELLKRKYIKTHVRFQKRERLKFNTKLGMNSPV